MTKADLVAKLKTKAGLSSKAAAERALNGIIGIMFKALSKGDKIKLAGFDTFAVKKQAARTGRNPQTGKPIKIAARKVVKFTVGKKLKKAVN
jgi:Bacterial nucleoid DNA-binding protein